MDILATSETFVHVTSLVLTVKDEHIIANFNINAYVSGHER